MDFLENKELTPFKRIEFNRYERFIGAPTLENARSFIGLGEGLTPSGDDFLLGYMICKNIFNKDEDYNSSIIESVKNKSTIISYNFFRTVLKGYMSEEWLSFLNSLDKNDLSQEAVKKILAFGGTSGVYMLTGFLVYLMKERGGNLYE